MKSTWGYRRILLVCHFFDSALCEFWKISVNTCYKRLQKSYKPIFLCVWLLVIDFLSFLMFFGLFKNLLLVLIKMCLKNVRFLLKGVFTKVFTKG